MCRGYDGTFHHVSADHLHRCINEFEGRYNIRGMDTIDMVGIMTEGIGRVEVDLPRLDWIVNRVRTPDLPSCRVGHQTIL